jgi:hypothetical protein
LLRHPARRSAAVAGIHAVPLGNEYPHGGDSGLCGSWRWASCCTSSCRCSTMPRPAP